MARIEISDEAFTVRKLVIENRHELEVLIALLGTITEEDLSSAIDSSFHVRVELERDHFAAQGALYNVLCDNFLSNKKD